MNPLCPVISCVVIGINSEKSISSCLESIQKIVYPKPPEIIYVDGGSKDRSVPIARSVNGVKVIELNLDKPTPGKGRNAGWRVTTGEWVQFFDSDTIASKDWLTNAVTHIEDDVGAIFGWVKEVCPDKNWFHFVSGLDWYRPVADAKFCGGNVLIRRSVLEETGGYDERLSGGEDPELAARMRKRGWKILGIDKIMCHHDINITGFNQYLKRSIRCGYENTEAGIMMLKSGEKAWLFRTIKLFIKPMGVVALVVLGLFPGFHLCLPLALAIIFFPVIKILAIKKRLNITLKGVFFYGLHCSINLWLQCAGVMKYFLNIQKHGKG